MSKLLLPQTATRRQVRWLVSLPTSILRCIIASWVQCHPCPTWPSICTLNPIHLLLLSMNPLYTNKLLIFQTPNLTYILHCLGHSEESVQVWGCVTFQSILFSLSGVVNSTNKPKLEDHTLSTVCNCLFSTTVHHVIAVSHIYEYNQGCAMP
jgi:hypothetical protein